MASSLAFIVGLLQGKKLKRFIVKENVKNKTKRYHPDYAPV